MSIVTALGLQAPAATRPRRAAGPNSFRLLDDADLHAPSAASASAPVGLHSLLTLQEAEGDAVQDRAARRHAGSMLHELSSVQRALLQGDPLGTSTALARLADAARHGAAAADPRLAAVVQAITMRAAVEAARRAPE